MALKAAIIGAGEIAKRAHAPGYLQAGADVVALCSRPGADLDGLAAAYHIERCYHDWRRLLDDGGFDVVSICTPPALHAEMAVECARRG
ncbi:MAG: Gfo/Idh/MocA family oxidoreductase, partial [Anaerolineae bacterium]|nr:Gfo/Idh/MocA family oxidoreductase [Anaerolineae bacterium]